MRILVLSERNDPQWAQCAHRIEKTLLDAAKRLTTSIPIELIEWSALRHHSGMSPSSYCIICHPTESTVGVIEDKQHKALYIFATGGERVVHGHLVSRIPVPQSIWFGGVYGREEQFGPWLTHWASSHFHPHRFPESKDALYSGKAGLGITAARLRKNILPIMIVLEAYLTIKPETGSLQAADEWLKESLFGLWREGALRSVCEDASLIMAATKTSTEINDFVKSEVVRLLRLLIPRSLHASYVPAIFFDYVARENFYREEKMMEVATIWRDELRELTSLLSQDSFVSVIK